MTIQKIIGVCAVTLGVLLSCKSASAQSLSARVEVGAAVPLTDPQANRFDIGGAVALKPELGIGSYVGVGPSLQFMALPSKVPGVSYGSATSLGAFARVKRPHDDKNKDSGFKAASPWVDGDLTFTKTDGLDRLGASFAAGVQVPTGESRFLWVGPFARYSLVSQEDGKAKVNTNSAKTLIVGLSFEFGSPRAKKHEQAPEVPTVPENPPVTEVKPVPPPIEVPRVRPIVQFPFDSASLEATQLPLLKEVVKTMLADTSYHLTIEGHASSEGQAKHNQKLSEKRAQSVLEFLVANGVDRKRLTAVGFGSTVPVADNATESGRVLNRRVEFGVNFSIRKVSE